MPPMSDTPPATVLVGDDEPLLRKLTERILAPRGFQVVTVADGDAAVRAVERRPDIGVVLLDANMPPEGAGAALRAIRELRPRVRVILTSGEALPPDLDREIADGEGLFLRKPFAPEALVRAVSDALVQVEEG